MFCVQCGSKFQDEALFCVQCGAKRVAETPPNVISVQTTAAVGGRELLISGGGVATTSGLRLLAVPISLVLAFGVGRLGFTLAGQFGYSELTTTVGPGWFGGLFDYTAQTIHRTALYYILMFGGIALGCIIAYSGCSFGVKRQVRTEIHVYNTGLAGVADDLGEGASFEFLWPQVQSVQAQNNKVFVTALGVRYEVRAANAVQIAALSNNYIKAH